MSKDLVGALKQEWWNIAREASSWKPKYQCISEIFNILTGNGEEVNVEIQCAVSDHKQADEFMKILTEWLVNENHIFVRIGILRIMPKLIEGFSKKTIIKHQNKLIETIMTKQWREKKRILLVLTTPTLIALLLKTGFVLNDDEYRGHLISALKHRGKESRLSAADFIAKCTMYHSNKKQIAALCENAQLGTILSQLAQCDKDKEVKVAACRVFYGLEAAGILKERWINRALPARLEVLEKDKFGRINLEIAAKEYNQQRTMLFGTKVGKNDDEDEKKSSVFTVEERRWRQIDGKLSPCGIIKNKHNCVKPENIEENKPIDPSSLEDNTLALEAVEDKYMHDLLINGYLRSHNVKRIPNDLCNLWITYIGFQFNEPDADTTFSKLQTWVKRDEESLKKTAKTTERIRTLSWITGDLMRLSPSKCSYLYDAIVGLAKECMGWEGRDARNPRLAKTFLKLISHVMAKGDINRLNAGIFNVYLSWALQRLAETKFNKLASECLLNTCYQFSAKVVFSQIEILLLQPTDPHKDPFKNDKEWGSVVKFIGEAVKEFGVDNFYVKRLIHIIHSKIPRVKAESSKQACYSSLTILYQQLGSDWGEVLLSGLSSRARKTLTKRWEKITNAGTYTQLRCTKNESIPITDASSHVQYRDIVSEEKVEEVPLSIKKSVKPRTGKGIRNNPSNCDEQKQDGIVGVSSSLPRMNKIDSKQPVSSNLIRIKAETIEILGVFKDNIKKDVYISLQKAFANDIIIATYATMDLAAWIRITGFSVAAETFYQYFKKNNHCFN